LPPAKGATGKAGIGVEMDGEAEEPRMKMEHVNLRLAIRQPRSVEAAIGSRREGVSAVEFEWNRNWIEEATRFPSGSIFTIGPSNGRR